MKTPNCIISVLMNGIFIGKLEKTMKHGLTFTYDEQWLKTVVLGLFPYRYH